MSRPNAESKFGTIAPADHVAHRAFHLALLQTSARRGPCATTNAKLVSWKWPRTVFYDVVRRFTDGTTKK